MKKHSYSPSNHKKIILILLVTATLVFRAESQVINTTPGSFNYGTGLVAGNPTGGTATMNTVSNDVTVTGSGTILTGSTSTSGIYNFHHFTINAGVTLTVSGTSPLVIRCTGTATILGTLSAAGQPGGNTNSATQGIAGTVAGGNGGGVNGGAGGSTGVFGNNGASYQGTLGRGLGGVPGNLNGGYGGSGGCHALVGQNGAGETNDGIAYGDSAFATVLNSTNLLGGCGGGGGGGNNSPARAGAGGGSGGGAFCITADSIIIDAAGLLTVRGGNGGEMSDHNSSAGGAGGGGSAGSILLQYKSNLTGAGIPNTNPSSVVTGYTVNIAGGQKGFYYVGGDGSKGYYLAQQDIASVPNTIDCYRTYQSGDWDDPNTWEVQPECAGSWVYPAVHTPNDTNSNSILIQNGNIAAIVADVSVDQVTFDNDPVHSTIAIDPGATMTLMDGTGNDLDFMGNANPRMLVSGTLVNHGQINGSTAITTIVNGTYIHAEDAGLVPTATWNTGSNCNITGIISGIPTNLGQNFHNFLWDCVSQTSFISLTSFPTGMNGTCEFRRAGSSNSMQVNWSNGGTYIWAGDLVSSCKNIMLYSGTSPFNLTLRDMYLNDNYGGTPQILMDNTSAIVVTVNIRNLNISGGRLNYNGTGIDNTTVNMTGDLTMTGGSIVVASSGYANVISNFNFSGTTQQNVNITGTALISGNNANGGLGGQISTLHITARAGSIVNFATPLACGNSSVYVTFDAAAGSTLMIPDVNGILATPGTTIGSVRMPSTGSAIFRTTGSYIYTGTDIQVTGPGLPATVDNLTFSNPAGVTCPAETVTGNLTIMNSVVTLSGSVSVTGNTTMNGSLLTLGNNNLTMTGTFSGSFSSSDKVITNGTGLLVKKLDAPGTVTFPVTDNVSVYTPCSVTYTGGTFDNTTSLSCRVTNAIEPNVAGPDKLNRYWTLADNIASGTGDATFNYLEADVIGNEDNISGVRYIGALEEGYGLVDAGNHQIVVNGFTDFSTANYTGGSGVLGIHDLTAPGAFSMYPNPVSSECTIRIAAGTKEGKCDIRIFDLTGALVQSVRNLIVTATGIAGFKIATNITSGVYFMRMTVDSNTFSQKLIVIKD